MTPSLSQMLALLLDKFPSGTGRISALDAIAVLQPVIEQSWLFTTFDAGDLPANKQEFAGLTLPEILARLILNVAPEAVTPKITSFTPSSAGQGDTVSVKGTSFGESQGTVLFNGISAIIQKWSPSRIVVTVPNGETSGSVVVVSAEGVPGVAPGTFTRKIKTYTATLQSYTTTPDDYTDICGTGTGVVVTRTSKRGTSTISQEDADNKALVDARELARNAIVCGTALPGYDEGAGAVMKADISVNLNPGESVGKYYTGDVIPCKGWTFEKTMRDICTRLIQPTYTIPTIGLSVNVPLMGERGESINPTFLATFGQHDAGVLTTIRVRKNGAVIDSGAQTPFEVPYSMIRGLTPVAFQTGVAYTRGGIKNSSDGKPDVRGYAIRQTDHPQDADPNFLSTVLTLGGLMPWFYGVSDTNVITNVYTQGNKVVAPSIGSLNVPSFGAGTKFLWFAVPRSDDSQRYKLFTTWFRTVLNTGSIGGSTNLFADPVIQSVTSQNLGANWTVDYDVYVSNYKAIADVATTLN